MDGIHQPSRSFFNTLHFDTCPIRLKTWLPTNTMQIHVRFKIHGYRNTRQIHARETQIQTQLPDIQCRSMSYRCKFEHIHEHTNVYPCYDSYKILHRNLGKEMSALIDTQGLRLVFYKVRFYPCDYNDLKSNMVETT